MKSSIKRVWAILIGGFISFIVSGTVMIGSVQAGEGYGGGYGGVPGCQSLVLATCFGAVWRWYSTSSNSFYISGTVDDNTCQEDGVAAGGWVTGCGDYGGYWRYAWVAQRGYSNWNCGYSYDQYDQRGISSIGSGAYYSVFFGGPMKYAYGYNWNDGRWEDVREIYLALQAQDPYTFSSGWGYGSSLGWFCGPSTVEEVQPQVKEYTLTAVAVDENGNSLRNIIRDVTSTVEEGNYTYVYRREKTNYIFKGWKYRSNDSYYASTDTWWGQYMYSDATMYAVYHEYKEYTLTGIAYDTDGNSLRNLMSNVTSTVEEGYYASITRRTAAAYTFVGWKSSLNSSSYISTNITYAVTALWSNQTVYAIYQHQEFSARARVSGGSSVSGNGTGFSQRDATQNIQIDCPNSGCDVAFDIAMKLEKGEGNVNFVVYRQITGGSAYQQTTNPAAPFAPSTSGSTLSVWLRSAYRNPYVESIRPGETLCYYVVFSPKGNGNVTVKACAYAKPSTFQGKINVTTPSGSDTVDWTDASRTVVKNIDNCPVTGCTVSFNHNLRRTAGTGSTNYVISRTSNYSSTVTANNNLGSGEEYFTRNPHQVLTDNNLTLKPGQVVCEILQFKPNNNYVTPPAYTSLKLCASALGKAQPDDPTNDPTTMEDDQLSDAFLDMRVKNPEGPTKYHKYQKAVYAKPGNTISYRATYNPILQYTTYLVPQRLQIDGGAVKPTGSLNTYYYLYQLFNQNRGNNNSWNNAIMVHSNGSFSYSTPHYYNLGKTDKQKEVNTHRVTISEVGKDLGESVTTNITKSNATAMSPSQVTFTSYSTAKDNLANVSTTSKTSIAHAYIPYNFDMALKIKTDDTDPVYAGEDKKIEYEIDVVPRKNPETTDGSDAQKYATIVPEFLGRIIIYTPLNGVKNAADSWGNGKTQDVCRYFGLTKDDVNCRYDNEENSPLNTTGRVDGIVNNRELKMSVPDQKAGTYICVAVATYPAFSGAYTNWSEKEGSKTWRISESKCFLIAKRPSFQVWGGSLYSGGTIKTSAAIKNNLKNLPAFSGVFVFSSWVEQSVTANGTILALASGAASGLANNIAGGGSQEPASDYCKYRVPLSLANYASNIVSGICPGAQVTGNSGISAVLSNQKSLIGQLPNEDSLISELSGGSTITINNSSVKNIVRYNVNGNATINANTVNVGRTHIINVAGDLTINGNIEYQSSTFTALDQIPKVIIYANNIKIGCTVRRIDAIIIAENDLNTCESNDINSRQNSYRLQVNGAIITNKLFFNRTYGAATGVNSKVPAEIVNYDTSTILWGRAKSDPNNEHKNLTAVYTHEIAPRY